MKLLPKLLAIIIILYCFPSIINGLNIHNMSQIEKKRKKIIIKKRIKTNILSDKKECLEDVDVIEEKYSKNGFKSLNKRMISRLRFIHGRCNPVVIVPGVLASRIEAVFNCSKIKVDKDLMKEIIFHCGKNKICKTNKIEKHIFWPDINTSAFKMELDNTNLLNSCYGYFLRYYNTQKSCKDKNENEQNKPNHCLYSEYIRLMPFGLSSRKEKDSFNCGFNAVNNFHNANGFIGLFANPESTKGFSGIYTKLISMGYKEGFSMAAIPYEFKEAFCQNKYFQETFHNIVHTLFKMTGKKVIVIAHSYGNLNSHYQLTSDPEFYKNRIAHFISLAAPFSGTYKGDFLVARGTDEFHKDESIIELDVSRFSQSQAMITTLTGYMLRKFNYIDTIKESHPELSEAFSKYLRYSTCLLINKGNSDKCKKEDRAELLNLFSTELGWMNKQKCLNYDYLSEWKNKNKIEKISDYDNLPIFNVCDFTLFDYVNCPSINVKQFSYSFPESDFNFNLIDNICKINENHFQDNFFISDCNDKKKKCTDEYLQDNSQTPLIYPKNTELLCKNLNKKLDLETCKNEMPSFFQFYEKENVKKIVREISKICDKEKRTLNHPGVPTTIVFNRSILTRSAISPTININRLESRPNNLFIGGDGTVDADSPLFVGLKWLYESKRNKDLPKVQIFDYCSSISKNSDYIYKGRESLFNGKSYQFLNCRCDYLNYKKVDNCAHAELLGDDNIINLISDIVIGEKIYNLQNEILVPNHIIAMNESTIKYDSSESRLCFDIFYEIYNRNFNRKKEEENQKFKEKAEN